MPHRRHVPRQSFYSPSRLAASGRSLARRPRAGWRACAVLTGTLAVCATVLPGSALAGTSSTPTMNQLLAKANALSQQIDSLSQQYDDLRIQLGQANAEAALARQGAKRDAALLKSDQSYVDNIAVEGYMNGGLSPSLQMLQAAQPQTMLNRASIMTQLQRENGAKINLVASAEVAAQRAIAAANQEEQRANHLKSSM